MKKLIILLLFTSSVFADRLDWIPPTERENGVALSPSEIGGYNIYNRQGTKINQGLVQGATYTVDRIDSDQILDVRTVDTDGRESLPSVLVTIPKLLTPPKPPTGITVTP